MKNQILRIVWESGIKKKTLKNISIKSNVLSFSIYKTNNKKINNRNCSYKRNIVLLTLKLPSLRSVVAKMEFQRRGFSNSLVDKMYSIVVVIM